MPDSNATINRTDVIARAFRRCGIDSPSSEETAYAVTTLNLLLKEKEQRDGRLIWAISNTPYSLTTVVSQGSYAVGETATTIPAYILALERVELVVGGAPYRGLDILDKSGFLNSCYRDESGEPVEAYFERAVASSDSKLWLLPTPSAAYTARLFYQRRLYDFDSATDNPDLPQEHALGLIKELAAELAPDFGIGLDKVVNYHEPKAAEARFLARRLNREKRTPRPLRTEYM